MTAVAHVGIGVPELERAVAWYADALGLEPLGGVASVRPGSGHEGIVAADVLGPETGPFRQAHLTGSNGVALELFEFERPVDRCAGIFHICLVPPSLDRTSARIVATGGRRLSRVWRIFPDAPCRTCYFEDPFGNTIELYSHSHERTYANRPAGRALPLA